MKIPKNKLQPIVLGFTRVVNFPIARRARPGSIGKSLPAQAGTTGFTLIEMMVTVGIIALFSVLVLVKHARFGEEIAINNLAHEVGLTIREAQVYGISVREGSGDFQFAYGVRFHMNRPTEFILFNDINGNGRFQSESNDPGELIESFSIKRGNRIVEICAQVQSVENCGLNAVHMTFLRPDPDASFVTSPSYPQADTVDVYIESPNGIRKKVSVNLTGQISVE